MATERAMTPEQVRDGMRAFYKSGEHVPDGSLRTWANAIDAHLRAEPVGFVTVRPSMSMVEVQIDPASMREWDRLKADPRILRDGVPVYLHPPAQARDARRSVGAVVQRVRDAELFDDGVDADLATNGVTTLADAFLRGRLAACDEIEAAMAREGE